MIRKVPIPPLLFFLFLLSACGGGGSDSAIPQVTETRPSHETKNVPVNAPIQATFSSPIDPATVNSHTFIVGGVLGSVTYQDQTATFTPAVETPLERGKEYHAVLTTGIKSPDGVSLRSNLSWSFVTEEGPDTTRPRIISILPEAGAKEVSTRAPILVVFSKPIDIASIASRDHFSIKGNMPGEYAYDAKTFTAGFHPLQPLAPATAYQVNLSGVKDLAGNPLLQDESWSFTTRSDADADPPRLEAKIPGNGETGVATNARIQIGFNEAID
ncbi:MAG TPA: Ig-like domain-containing protein, partial [Candidatus Manganitrophaceae bacterium]|nr:Ig-like domain-containing protein [Candidatus Manganitrophaceae bacterium]